MTSGSRLAVAVCRPRSSTLAAFRRRETESGLMDISFRSAPAAPELRRGLCSDCLIPPIVVADGDMRACPRCFAVLWHKDYAAELAQRKRQAEEAARKRAAEVRAAKEAAKKATHQIVGEAKPSDNN
jgi:hypothetical protein